MRARTVVELFKTMKKLLLFFFLIVLLCCNKKTVPSNLSIPNGTEDSNSEETAKRVIKINAGFPFGCPDLAIYSYPKHWKEDPENYGRLKLPEGQEFDTIGVCFKDLNKVENIAIGPEILGVDHLLMGKDFLNTVYFDRVAQKAIDSLKYRLPDIGNYQCYYYFEKSKLKYGEYGNLLLLDPKTKRGKTLNVYYEIGGDQHVDFRYFYLNAGVLRIYEGSCYDDGCGLRESFTVEIKAEGQINIKELK